MCEVNLPGRWTDSDSFETALMLAMDCEQANPGVYHFIIGPGCRLMVDAAVKLLSLANQAADGGAFVLLDFRENAELTIGYLERMGFFELLVQDVYVLPERPAHVEVRRRRGGNPNLVEFASLAPNKIDEELPSALAACVENGIAGRVADVDAFGNAAYTIFAELIGNVYRHSQTKLNGYAALQTYARAGQVTVCVADSGLGIMQTLRAGLREFDSVRFRRSDSELLSEMVETGISRFGPGNGCGIWRCASRAMALKAKMEVRMSTSRALFAPLMARGPLNLVTLEENLPRIHGTHITIRFRA